MPYGEASLSAGAAGSPLEALMLRLETLRAGALCQRVLWDSNPLKTPSDHRGCSGENGHTPSGALARGPFFVLVLFPPATCRLPARCSALLGPRGVAAPRLPRREAHLAGGVPSGAPCGHSCKPGEQGRDAAQRAWLSTARPRHALGSLCVQ